MDSGLTGQHGRPVVRQGATRPRETVCVALGAVMTPRLCMGAKLVRGQRSK